MVGDSASTEHNADGEPMPAVPTVDDPDPDAEARPTSDARNAADSSAPTEEDGPIRPNRRENDVLSDRLAIPARPSQVRRRSERRLRPSSSRDWIAILIAFLTLAFGAAAYFSPRGSDAKTDAEADAVTSVSIANPWADLGLADQPPDGAFTREVICGDFSRSVERVDAVDCIQRAFRVLTPCFKHPAEADLVACASKSNDSGPSYLSYRVVEWREFSDDVFHPDLVTVNDAVNTGLPWAVKVDGRWCYQGFEPTSLGDAVDPELRNWSCGGGAGKLEVPGDNYFESPSVLVFSEHETAADSDRIVAFNLVNGSESSTIQVDRPGSSIKTSVVEEALY